MPRPLRYQGAGVVHHVVCKGNDGQSLFNDQSDYEYYLSLLTQTRQDYPVDIFNYVLMNNHIHLLVEPQEEGSLSRFMEIVTKSYAKYFNKKYDHTGHVFQGRFKSFIIQRDRYYFACSRYIDLNPVKAGIVNDPREYQWSGYAELACGKKSPLKLAHHDLYQSLGASSMERQIAYRTLVMSYQGEDLDLLNKRAGLLGDRDFKNRIKEVIKSKG